MIMSNQSKIKIKTIIRRNYGENSFSPRNVENCNSPFQRKFFKNNTKIEKFIQEEKFDRQKFKERFLENI